MGIDSALANVFGLRGEAWQRHANPWSVYTRIPIPVLLVAAVWSRQWLDWWSIAVLGAVLVWTFVNPRAFPPPQSLDHWASRSVLGETVWAARKSTPVPERHRVAPWVLTGISSLGVPFIVWGVVVYDFWMTAFGLTVQLAGKLWFLDRMALLYDDTTATDPGDHV